MINCQSENVVDPRFSPEQQLGLLETLRYLRASLGDGLNDAEFNCFLQAQNLRPEEGFKFLCFWDGCVTLLVPPQVENSWYPKAGWIASAKEKTAIEFAKRCGLILSEPPDVPLTCDLALNAHHHLRFSNRNEIVVIAHPKFLKVRLYATINHIALKWSKGILREISALYRDL